VEEAANEACRVGTGMRVGVDVTPLLGTRTGIGTYTAHLLQELARLQSDGLELVATAFTGRRVVSLAEFLPSGVRVRSRRIPARFLRAAWLRVPFPPVELLTGPVDVFHGTNFKAPPTLRAASVVTIHDLSYLRMPETVDAESLGYQHLVPSALARGARVCTVSAAVASEVQEAYDLDADRITVTPLGVDPSWYTASPMRPPVEIGSDYVVAVGMIEPRKNLQVLLHAYRLAADRAIQLPPLLLIGPQGWGSTLDTSGIPANRIVQAGYLPYGTLQGVVAGAQLLAFPSLYEGFGLPPLEALATGVSVLASDLPVTREVLGDQATYADPRSAEAMLGGLLEALERPAGTRETRQDRARLFTWERCAAATLDAYRQAALAGGGRANRAAPYSPL
jgi:glycosyltransferase involved in cell wall biosynthesis